MASASNEVSFVEINKNSKEFWDLEELFQGWLNNQIDCYVHERVKKGLRPLSFNLIGASIIVNKNLETQHDACRTRLTSSGRSGDQLRSYRAFHGTHPRNVEAISKNGLLRIGHPLNPSKSTDPGFFGKPTKGIYVSRKLDYCLKYSNRGEPLEAKDEVKVIMFDVLPGLSKHITEMKLAMDPTPGFDSHSSANWSEWYLFNEDQCVPKMVLTVRAFENRRTDQDDAKEDTSGMTPAPSTVPSSSSSSSGRSSLISNETKVAPSTTTPSSDFGIMSFGGMYYGSQASELVHRITKDSIELLPPLPHPISLSAAVRVGDNVYVTGGTNKGFWAPPDPTNTEVHCYSIPNRSWSTCPSMKKAHVNHTAALLPDKTSFIVMGGDRTKETEIFDTKTQTWRSGPEMTYTHSGGCAISFGGKVYVFGGSGENYTKTPGCEVLENGHWRAIAPLPEARGDMVPVIVGDTIMLLGGALNLTTNTCLEYTPSTNKWRDVPWTLPEHRTNFGAAYDAKSHQLMITSGSGKEAEHILVRKLDGSGTWSKCPSSTSPNAFKLFCYSWVPL